MTTLRVAFVGSPPKDTILLSKKMDTLLKSPIQDERMRVTGNEF